MIIMDRVHIVARVKVGGVFEGEYWVGYLNDLDTLAAQAGPRVSYSVVQVLPVTAKKDDVLLDGKVETYWTGPGSRRRARARKAEAQRNTQNVQAHRKRMRDRGYREVRVWVKDGQQQRLRDVAREMRDE